MTNTYFPRNTRDGLLPATSPERKQVTVLFCDIADYAQRSSALDPEDLADEIRVFQSLCHQAANKYQGHIANYLGDGILMLFGYPKSHEFSAEFAAMAALEMVESITRNNQTRSWKNRAPLNVRIGIATSLAVIEERAGQQRDQVELVFGEAPSLASRLQSLALTNTVVTSSHTKRLIGDGFHYRHLGQHRLKGFTKPTEVWSIASLKKHSSGKPSLFRGDMRVFVARRNELHQLCRAFSECVKGKPQSVLLSGAWGIGKTRLVKEFVKTIRSQPGPHHYRIHVTCTATTSKQLYRPLITALCHWTRISLEDDPKTIRAEIKSLMQFLGVNRGIEVSLICGLLLSTRHWRTSSVNTHDGQPSVHWTEHEIIAIANVLIELLFRLTTRLPVLLIIENLQWADCATRSLFGRLLGQLSQQRLFIVVTNRGAFATDCHGPHCVSLSLDKLCPEDAGEMITKLFSGTPLPETVKQMIIDKSDGIPLFIEELCWSLLVRVKHGWRDQHDTDKAAVVPVGLQDAFNQQLDRDEKTKPLLQLGSVFGDSFSFSDIVAVAPEQRLTVDRQLKHLVLQGVLTLSRQPQKGFPNASVTECYLDTDIFQFRHSLFRDACYQSMLKKTRQNHHEAIIKQLLRHGKGVQPAEPWVRAYHFGSCLCESEKTPGIQQCVEIHRLNEALGLYLEGAENMLEQFRSIDALELITNGLVLAQRATNIDSQKRLAFSRLLNAMDHGLQDAGPRDNAIQGPNALTQNQLSARCRELLTLMGTTGQSWYSIYGFWCCLINQQKNNHPHDYSFVLSHCANRDRTDDRACDQEPSLMASTDT